MTPAELARIKARVTPTICETWQQDEHDGAMASRIEGRISADDFMSLCAAVESASTLIGDATSDMGRAIARERGACSSLATATGHSLTCDCTYRNGMDPETGEQLCARRDGCSCAEIIDCADTIAGKINARA